MVTGAKTTGRKRAALVFLERERKIQAAIAAAMGLTSATVTKTSINLKDPLRQKASVKAVNRAPKRPKPKPARRSLPKKLTPEEIKGRKQEAQRRKHLETLQELANAAEADRLKNITEVREAHYKQIDRMERQKERLEIAQRFVSAVEICSFAGLLAEWRKHAPTTSSGHLASSELSDLSDRIVSAVEGEWERRRRYAKHTDYFDWPTTEIGIDRGGGISTSEWVTEGLLRYMGYHVGTSSTLTPDGRCRLLTRVYVGQLPPVNGPAYMSGWGGPGSARRLEKLAQSLAAFARQAKRRSSVNLTEAIQSWEGDLDYLHDNYYAPAFPFKWPSH